MRATVILVMIGLMLGGAAISAPAASSGKAFLWTGYNWQQVSQDGKAGYIFGIGNMADFETAASGGKTASVSHAFVNVLKSMTVLQIIEAVDAFYKENPGKLDTPVIEVVLRRCVQARPPDAPRGRKAKP
jgi:hypothetical protein